jgi:hypothetical protein
MAATMERIKDAIGEATSRFLPLIESIANFLSDTEKLKQTFSAIATIIGGIAGVSIGMSLQRKAMLATEIQSRLVTNQLLATQMMQEKSDARRLVSNRGIVLVKKAQNLESTIGLTKTQVQQVAETGLARTRIIGAAASAASFAGPLALLAGGAVLSYFMSKLAMSGVSGGGGMSGGGGGEIPTPEAGIEPVNKEAEVIKNNESRKINEGRMPDPKYYILQVDPITGNKMERQVTKEYYESQGGQFKNN